MPEATIQFVPLSFIDACSPATHFKNAAPQSPIKRTSKGGALF